MKILVFWDMTPSRLDALTMEATISSETSVTVHRFTRRHISESCTYHLHNYDNVESLTG
jgi:hypothetical protein